MSKYTIYVTFVVVIHSYSLFDFSNSVDDSSATLRYIDIDIDTYKIISFH